MVHPEIQRIVRRYQVLAAMAACTAIDSSDLLCAWEEVVGHCHRQMNEFLEDPSWLKTPKDLQDAKQALDSMNGDMRFLFPGLVRQSQEGGWQ